MLSSYKAKLKAYVNNSYLTNYNESLDTISINSYNYVNVFLDTADVYLSELL